MTIFAARTANTAVIPCGRDRVWSVLSDADTVARITPLVSSIDADHGRWTWKLQRIAALGVSVTPNLVECMSFDPGHEIRFERCPDARDDARAAATGRYTLRDAPGGATEVAIDITIEVDLPLPRLARRAVERVMAETMARTGQRFARNLYAELGLDPAAAVVGAAS